MGKGLSTVRGYSKSLEEKGLIKRVYREKETNEFDFSPLIKQLEALDFEQKTGVPLARFSVHPCQELGDKEDALRRYREERGFKSINQIISYKDNNG